MKYLPSITSLFCFIILIFPIAVSSQSHVSYWDCTNCTEANHQSSGPFYYNMQAQHFNGTSSYVQSDFGPRDIASNNDHYDWHGGIDYSTSGPNDIADAILALTSGVVSNLSNSYFKWIIINGDSSIIVNNQSVDYDFGYGHMFLSSISNQRSGSYFWQQIVGNTSRYAIIINDTTALYTNSTSFVVHPITHDTISTTNQVIAGRPIGPIGKSIAQNSSVPSHLHLYAFENNVFSVSNDEIPKNPLQFLNYQRRDYELTFKLVYTEYDNGHSHSDGTNHYSPNQWPRFNDHGNGISLKYPGTISSQVLTKADITATIASSGETYSNGVLAIEKFEVFIKYETSDSNYIKGPVYESKILYNGKVNGIVNDDTYPVDLETRGQALDKKTGIQPWAYAGINGRTGSFDYLNFANFKTRIHKDDPGNWSAADSLLFMYAYCPQDARYNDGNYQFRAKLTDIRDSVFTNDPISLKLDNYKPFIQKAEVSVGSKVIYREEWMPSHNCLRFSNFVLNENLSSDSLALGIVVWATGSEPLRNLILSVPALETGNLEVVDSMFINGFYKYKFLIDSVELSAGNYDIKLLFSGNDVSNNFLIALDSSHIDSCVFVPTRTSSGWTTTTLTYGTDSVHKFLLKCGRSTSNTETTVNITGNQINIYSEVVQPISCDGGTISLELSGGIPPYEISWEHDTVLEGLIAINLAPGEYCVTVTDALCGLKDTCIMLEQGISPFAITNYGNTSECYDDGEGHYYYPCDGFIEVDYLSQYIGPEDLPITYHWIGPGVNSTNQNIYDLCYGQYNLTITTATGCEYFLSKFICCCISYPYDVYPACPENLSEMLLVGEVANATNQYSEDGSIDLTVYNYATTLSYIWYSFELGTFSFLEDVNNLQPGEYFVTVTDGCQTDSAKYIVGYDNCYNNSDLAVINVELYNIFPDVPSPFPGSTGSIILDIYTDHLPHTTEWFRYNNYSDPFPQQINVYGDSLLNWPPGVYGAIIEDASGCKLSKIYEIESCENIIDFDLDYSSAAYCTNGHNGSFNIFVNNGFPDYNVKLFKGDLANQSLILINEINTNEDSFSITGLDEAAVYYIQIIDNHGLCGSKVQFIPCECDIFRANLYEQDPCGQDPLHRSKVVLGGSTGNINLNPEFLGSNEYEYFNSFFNWEDLIFTLIWPGSDTTKFTDDHIISGPDDYVVNGNGEVKVKVSDPFGCNRTYYFYFGNYHTCLANGGADLITVLDDFYVNGYDFQFDNVFVEIGCQECEYCGPPADYCGLICPEGYLTDEGETYVVIPGTIRDLFKPCEGLSFVCPLMNEDSISVPEYPLYSQFIDWDADPKFSNGNCVLPCGCLYAPNTFPNQPEPLWIETEIVIEGLECERPPVDEDPITNECEPCERFSIEPILDGPAGSCQYLYKCLETGCETPIPAPTAKCNFDNPNTDDCIYIEYCIHTHEIIDIQYFVPCDLALCDEDIVFLLSEEIFSRSSSSSNTFNTKGYLKIFPNPTKDNLYYVLDDTETLADRLIISDIYGKIIDEVLINYINHIAVGNIDVSYLVPGVYLIFTNGNHSLKPTIFIKV